MNAQTLIATITATLLGTTAFAFTPADCGVSGDSGTHALQRFCTNLRKRLINADPGHGLIGTLEKADPIEGEPASRHYFWINTGEGVVYFDGDSTIGRRILTVCKLGHLCAVKVAVEKSWEHDVGHATFWIAKLVGDPISQ